jgi:hypothetical protein
MSGGHASSLGKAPGDWTEGMKLPKSAAVLCLAGIRSGSSRFVAGPAGGSSKPGPTALANGAATCRISDCPLRPAAREWALTVATAMTVKKNPNTTNAGLRRIELPVRRVPFGTRIPFDPVLLRLDWGRQGLGVVACLFDGPPDGTPQYVKANREPSS